MRVVIIPVLIGVVLAVCPFVNVSPISPTQASPQPPLPARTAMDDRPRALLIGDSLASGLKTTIGDHFTGWDIMVHSKAGRGTPWGLERLRRDLRRQHPHTVLVSFGTNDGPSAARFRRRVRRFMATVGPRTCVVWSTIYRPARKGPYRQLNRVLRQEAARSRRLSLIEWERAVRTGAASLKDELHPDRAGTSYRSRLFYQAARAGCPAAG